MNSSLGQPGKTSTATNSLFGISFVALFFLSPPAIADENASKQLQTLVTTHRFIPDEPRADPDQPSLRYGLQGYRWKGMAGGSVVLVGLDSDKLRIGLSLAGFVELINFDIGDPVPWQSYRANIGFDAIAESPRLSRAILPSGGRLFLAIGWFHESDHAASLAAYQSKFLLPSGFGDFGPYLDNANFSSYEYIKIRAGYRQPLWGKRLETYIGMGMRLFPEPIDKAAIRGMHSAFFVESRVSLRLGTSVRAFVSTYDEIIDNEFVAREHGFQFGQDHTPLRYAIVNVGVDLIGKSGTIMSPFVSYSNSNGRGIDFPRYYGSELGVGIAWLL